MDDTISRRDAVSRFSDLLILELKGKRLPTWNEVYNAMQDVPSADVPHWIPCSERLPFAEYGEGDSVLTTCGYRNGDDTSIRWIRMLYFNGGNWCFPTGETYEEKVYAWMPLPEPYKAKSEEV